MSTVVINEQTPLGGYRYPFIGDFPGWRLESHKFIMGSQRQMRYLVRRRPTLRIVKDDGVSDFFVYKGRKVQTISVLEEMGFVIRKPTHPQTGKRLSRIFRPSLAFGVFTPEEMPVIEMDVNPDLWDGAGTIARAEVRKLTAHLPYEVRQAYERTSRFEFTVVDNRGQFKGHLIVRGRKGIRVPEGSAKTQVCFTKGVFVDIRPVKAHDHLWTDVQTLINHYHVLFDNRTLLRWLQTESERQLATLEKGEVDISGLLANIHDEREFEQLMSFPVFEFLASGGKLHQSPYMTRQWGKMYARKLESRALYGHRLPIPCGFRLYLTAAAVGGYRLALGQALVDFKSASIYVSDTDYTYIAKTLGGADQDDAVNIIWDGHQAMLTRNPNMRGEYELVTIVNPEELQAHGIQPCKIDWDRLDKIPALSERTYGELEPMEIDSDIDDYPTFANEVMKEVARRLGVLGRHINVLASCTLTLGDEPMEQPATGEAIIDASVKDLTINLSPVIEWDGEIALSLAKKSLCRDAVRRLSGFVSEEYEFKEAANHWLDNLEDKVEAHIEWFLERVQNLADKATPPGAVYQGVQGNEQGRALVGIYNAAVRTGHLSGEVTEDDFEQARKDTLAYLSTLTDPLTALVEAWTVSWGSDSAIWQKEISPLTFKALRRAGVLSEIIWDGYGIVADPKDWPRTAHVQVNGTWFNLMPDKAHYRQMRDVPPERRSAIKRALQANAHTLVGRKVAFNQDGDRILAYSDIGTFLGYVARDHEDRTHPVMTVVYATTYDGNLKLVLE